MLDRELFVRQGVILDRSTTGYHGSDVDDATLDPAQVGLEDKEERRPIDVVAHEEPRLHQLGPSLGGGLGELAEAIFGDSSQLQAVD